MKKESGDRTVYIEISIILKFMERPKHQVSFLKNMGCPEENQLLGGNFYAVLDEMDADILQNTKKWK